MEFAPGAIQLDDIVGGTLQVGEVPNARLETYLTALADALTAGGVVPHAKLTGELVTLANALKTGGRVPYPNLIRVEAEWANTGVITVLSVLTRVLDFNYNDAEVGDRFLINVKVGMVKGGTGGVSAVSIVQSGGAGTVIFYEGSSKPAVSMPNVPAGTVPEVTFSTIGEVTGAGIILMQVQGQSLGSDSSIPIGAANLLLWVLPGA